jgi:hypothetical protein
MAVVCPQNAYPGAYLKLTTPPPDMHPIKVRVPQNIKPGMSFQIQYKSHAANTAALNSGGLNFVGNLNSALQHLISDSEKLAIELKHRAEETVRVSIEVPAGTAPGSTVQVHHLGFKFQVVIPKNTQAGENFIADLPTGIARQSKENKSRAKQLEDMLDAAEAHGDAAREVFAQFDANHDGVLDYKEFAEFLKSFGLPKSMLATEIAKVDLDHDHSISWDEFVVYYNLLKQRVKDGDISGQSVHAKFVENPFPKAMNNEKECNVVITEKIGIGMVTHDLKHKITIQFSSLQTYFLKQNSVTFQLTPAKGSKRFVLEFENVGAAKRAIASIEACTQIPHSSVEQAMLAAEREELALLREQLEAQRKAFLNQKAVSGGIFDPTLQDSGTVAKVNAVLSSGEEAKRFHDKAVKLATETKRKHLQDRLSARRQQKGAGVSNQVRRNMMKEAQAKKAVAKQDFV